MKGARELLQLNSHEVARRLIDLALSEDTAPYIAIKAQTAVLDRCGIPAGLLIAGTVHHTDDTAASVVVRERLAKLAAAGQVIAGDVVAPEPDPPELVS